MLYYVFLTLFVIICALLFVVVLLQQGKGGDIAAAFGGASSQTAFGARSGATVLTRATTVLGTLFLVGAFVLSLMGRTSGGGSVVSGVAAPADNAQPAAPALPMPATPAPAENNAAPASNAPAQSSGQSGSQSQTPGTPAQGK